MRTDYLRRWLVFAAAVLGVLLTARLGVWQLSRADQKLAIQAAIDARAGMGVLDTASLANDAGAAMLQQYRKAQVRGRWVAERTVFLDNRQMHGQPGFFVVTPLRLEGRSDVLLVQRGWVPRDAEQRTRLPDLPLPEGVVTLQGRLAPPPARLYEFSAQSAGRIRQNLDLNAFAAETGLRLLPMSLLQTQTETTSDAPAKANDGLQREWVRPAADVQKNHGYAFQWFAMALLITGLYVWFQLVRPRLRR